MNEKQKTTLVHAINHFGVEGQINKAVEPVKCIIEGVKNLSGSEISALLTNAEKFCKMGGEENNGCFDNG